MSKKSATAKSAPATITAPVAAAPAVAKKLPTPAEILALARAAEKPVVRVGRKSMFEAYGETVVELHSKGWNSKAIHKFLSDAGLDCKYGAVKHFIDVKFPDSVKRREKEDAVAA